MRSNGGETRTPVRQNPRTPLRHIPSCMAAVTAGPGFGRSAAAYFSSPTPSLRPGQLIDLYA